MSKRAGFSLLELVIASAILAIVLSTIYILLFATDRMTMNEAALRDAQFQLHNAIDDIGREARESSQGLIRTVSFNEAAFPSNPQTLVVLISARDATGVFQVLGAKADWQKLIVYAPYYNATLNTTELMRYEVFTVADEFKSATMTPTITIDATNITLQGTVVERSKGQPILRDIDYFRVDLNIDFDPKEPTVVTTNSFKIDVALSGNSLAETKQVNLAVDDKGRN